ncbi:MAG: hypothetical protein J0M04_10035 [Verrucomicrobia bacterium]|nr:hypothetical protein [Verrucomicrobiota bacterium]
MRNEAASGEGGRPKAPSLGDAVEAPSDRFLSLAHLHPAVRGVLQGSVNDHEPHLASGGFWQALGPDFRQIVLTWTSSGPVRKGIVNQHATILTNVEFPGNKSSGIRDVWENLPSKRMGYAFHEPDYGQPGATSEGITRRAVGALGAAAATVLDPFLGIGNTLVISKERGIRAIGIESAEQWAEVAARRLENTTPGFDQCVA